MRRTTTLQLAVAGTALAALSIGGATAFADMEDSEPTAVVNKNGHEVNEHAAHGQARAAEARAQRLEKAAEREADDTDTEAPEASTPEAEAVEEDAPAEHTDNGNHGGPDAHAGDHPNPKAFKNPQEHEPQGPKEVHEPQGPKDGNGPNEHAGDHPNENATDGPGNNGQGQQK
jgi:hypothetical protein